MQSSLRRTMDAAGTSGSLVQAFTEHGVHSYFADPVYPAAFAALLDWIDRAEKPTPVSVARRCAAMEATFGPGCRLSPDYFPAPLASRVAPRPGI
jgi:hypothetical protein